jgi:hypothetical protein
MNFARCWPMIVVVAGCGEDHTNIGASAGGSASEDGAMGGSSAAGATSTGGAGGSAGAGDGACAGSAGSMCVDDQHCVGGRCCPTTCSACDTGGACTSYEANYFVSPDGSDANPGTFDSPFATWGKLGEVLKPGDLAYIRGGTYTNSVSERYQCLWSGLNGTAQAPIRIWAYPGETPVWDFSGATLSNTPVLVGIRNSNYLHIKGLRVTNAAQPTDTSVVFGWYLWESSNNTIENCAADHLGGFGFQIHGIYWVDVEDDSTAESADNLFLNCDAYELADPLSPSPYDGSNGFNLVWTSKATRTTFQGCRAWYCSDDGFDGYHGTSQGVVIESSWSFMNGYVNGIASYAGAVGNGFKLGPLPDGVDHHYSAYKLSNCVAAQNTDGGFVVYGTSGQLEFYNNTAYSNGTFGFFSWSQEDAQLVLKNNLSYFNLGGQDPQRQAVDYWGDHRYWTEETNAWSGLSGFSPPNLLVTVTDSDLLSVDVTQLMQPRKEDGSLPDVSFGHLASGSVLINAGVDVGLPHLGSAPDIGAFESQ